MQDDQCCDLGPTWSSRQNTARYSAGAKQLKSIHIDIIYRDDEQYLQYYKLIDANLLVDYIEHIVQPQLTIRIAGSDNPEVRG